MYIVEFYVDIMVFDTDLAKVFHFVIFVYDLYPLSFKGEINGPLFNIMLRRKKKKNYNKCEIMMRVRNKEDMTFWNITFFRKQ